MSELPGDLLFTDEHEWLRREDDGSVTIGITDHAQKSLGDLVYVELPEAGTDVEEGGEMAVVSRSKRRRMFTHRSVAMWLRSMKTWPTTLRKLTRTRTATDGLFA